MNILLKGATFQSNVHFVEWILHFFAKKLRSPQVVAGAERLHRLECVLEELWVAHVGVPGTGGGFPHIKGDEPATHVNDIAGRTGGATQIYVCPLTFLTWSSVTSS